VIAGEPNVGKSTLMNRLLERDRSIVTDIPGTTRDTIEEQLILAGIPIRLIDTAGLRDAACRVEQEGIRRAEDAIRTADVFLYIVDGASGLTRDDRTRLAAAVPERSLVLVNKRDLGDQIPETELPASLRVVRVSLLRDADVETIKNALVDILGVQEDIPPHAVVSERHHGVLATALAELDQAMAALNRSEVDGALLAAEHLRGALERLGEITGREYSTALLDAIFSRFCIGK
jgi:tRNA modification GTPase